MTAAVQAGTRHAPVLEADCVSKSYRGRLVLKSASLRVTPGRVTALVGRNGAGKSTLLRITTGTIAPDSGYVRLRGEMLLAASLASLAHKGVFFLPDRDLLYRNLLLGKQLEAVADTFGVPRDTERIASDLGISSCLERKPRTLSGGERRRAEIAVALARRPEILLADEPLRGIAPIDAELILGAFRAFARQGGAVVLTGHELPTLMAGVDDLTWCTAGTTREFPSGADAMRDFAFRRDFLP
jgi:ABC-type multidrug transport system ATPase subunit